MPTVATPSALQGNLSSLGERNTDLVERIRAAAPRPDVVFDPTPQDVPSVSLAGLPLCSRHRPLEEAARLADRIDLVEHAVVCVLGFGAGYHVQELARRLDGTGLIIVFEPDVGLLRAVLSRIDHSSWLRSGMVVFVTDPSDRGELAGKLQDAESIIAQGVCFLEHPPSRLRLEPDGASFSALVGEMVRAVKTSFMTTLMRSTDTVRNLLGNLDHYAAGPGVAELADLARGHPAVVVAAGPSLRRNMHLLAAPGIRDRCVIIAAQTTLAPLLGAGIRPHFVTALDYHEISRRFYENLSAEAVGGTTLVADPKAHPVILDSFPGPVRCCANKFLDDLLDDAKRPMGTLPAGSTVAHLAVYLAHFLGCNPIILTGQDLSFSDGLYYAPGTAIDEVWAPELNPFNTIEMMEWQRIVRHRLHLSRATDVHGRPVLTDTQMLTYLQQFERDFARYRKAGVQVVDATEGGLAKQHTKAMTLAEALDRHAAGPVPPLPIPRRRLDPGRLKAAMRRVDALRRDISCLRETSRRSAAVIRDMLDDQADRALMSRHFEKIERYRREVQQRFDAFEVLNHLNQLGVYKRFKADRRLHLRRDLDPVARQRAQLDRDLESVTWIADTAQEMCEQLGSARRLLAGDAPAPARPPAARTDGPEAPACRIAALVPIDPERNGMGIARSLAAPCAGRPVLQATLERIGSSRLLESIILIAPRGFDVEAIIDRNRIGLPVIIETSDGSPFGPEQVAIAAARRWSDTCWRGGIGGMSVYDEVLCPAVMSPIMEKRGLTAAVIVGPDWPLIDMSGSGGGDAVIARHLELPKQHNLVFSQAPPGLGACLVSAALMRELILRNRLSTIGALLVYQPHAPQPDPIARAANVQVDPRVGRSRIRATFDSARYRSLIETTLPDDRILAADAVEVAGALRRRGGAPEPMPRHLVLEPVAGSKRFRVEWARELFGQLAEAHDAVVTLAGADDPLEHPCFDEIVTAARAVGLGVHVRSRLLVDRPRLDRLLACEPEVVSVDVLAASAETYRRLTGLDRFEEVIANIDHLVKHRRRLTDHAPAVALGLPWVVPRMQRRAETLGEIETFYDRWQMSLGTAVIDGAGDASGEILPTETPRRVRDDLAGSTLTIRGDGTAAVRAGPPISIAGSTLADLWARARPAADPDESETRT